MGNNIAWYRWRLWASYQGIGGGLSGLGWRCGGWHRRGPDLVGIAARGERYAGNSGWVELRHRLTTYVWNGLRGDLHDL